jgi:hypothetical protein
MKNGCCAVAPNGVGAVTSHHTVRHTYTHHGYDRNGAARGNRLRLDHDKPQHAIFRERRAPAAEWHDGQSAVQVLNELADVTLRKMRMSRADTHALLDMLREP